MCLNSNEKVLAPSGFEFPFFPYTEDTFVRIKDKTKYKSEWLYPHNRNTYDQEDFDHDLEPYMLDIEVQGFFTSLKFKNLQKLGLKQPPKGWEQFHSAIWYSIDDEEECRWPMTKTIHKQFLQAGLLKELPDTRENREMFFLYKTANELKEICQAQKLKFTGNKSTLISRIIEHGKPSPKPMLTISGKYIPMLELIAEKYIESIQQQLEDKPAAYHKAVWELVAEEYGSGGELPYKARAAADKLYMQSG